MRKLIAACTLAVFCIVGTCGMAFSAHQEQEPPRKETPKKHPPKQAPHKNESKKAQKPPKKSEHKEKTRKPAKPEHQQERPPVPPRESHR